MNAQNMFQKLHLNVKWGKSKFEDIEVNTKDELAILKAQLFTLTSVPPNKQKLLHKGSILKDEDSCDSINIKKGSIIVMLGTAEPTIEAPSEKVIFTEDMPKDQLLRKLNLPSGLYNLGNTCYLNSTVHFLHSIPELSLAISQASKTTILHLKEKEKFSFLLALNDLFLKLDSHTPEITPIFFLKSFYTLWPKFAEKSEREDVFMQQDANECFLEIFSLLSNVLPSVTSALCSNNSPVINFNLSTNPNIKFVDQYLSGTMEVRLKNTNNNEEPEILSSETFTTLKCFVTTDVKYIETGIRQGLKETIEKKSHLTNTDSTYTKDRQITRLPAYVVVQYMRFFYKAEKKINTKILKDVKFPATLDLSQFCSRALKENLEPMRQKYKKYDDFASEIKKLHKSKEKESSSPNSEEKKLEQNYFTDDIGSNNSGYYALKAVIAHKGRSSDSGHYIACVKEKERWFFCDDENVTEINEEAVLKLSGGGDWFIGYLLLYGPKDLPILPAS